MRYFIYFYKNVTVLFDHQFFGFFKPVGISGYENNGRVRYQEFTNLYGQTLADASAGASQNDARTTTPKLIHLGRLVRLAAGFRCRTTVVPG